MHLYGSKDSAINTYLKNLTKPNINLLPTFRHFYKY